MPTSRPTRVSSSANEESWSTMVLTVFFRARISPCASTVIFWVRSPRATAVATWAMLRTWVVRFDAMKFTLSVRPRQVPATPRTCACPPSLPSDPTSRATRVTSSAKDESWSTIVFTVFFRARISPRASTVMVWVRSPRATAVVTWAMLRTWSVRLPASWFTLSVRSRQRPDTPETRACPHSLPSVPPSLATGVVRAGHARVSGVSGRWRDLTESVSQLAGNLTDQVRNIAQVTTAVARGDLTQTITVDARGEILALKNTVNTMVDQLSSFADEVTRVAREVGSEGKLGGQAQVRGVSGTWRGLTDNVNYMASNLTAQVRNIAQVATAVARGDLSQKITVDARGEILDLKSTVNTMVDQLSSFADEVTRVAREVGSEGKLGGQAQVRGVAGTWRYLTDNVNFMASNLTSQVRNIAQVATAVARGDLTQK